ncbi:MAG: PspC domain-containing protein [Prevotella sp.]|nr:PspC domain-containing protein [Prevotella sp.]MDD7097914.1 PspC domain-containing protein [Prevotellaceae bacterium]MDY5005964.1 PspC domain-containing protein [Prevotella sp.]MDY5250532.1 PspC domain-containing protein [Prevotella sp.]
MKKRLTLSDDRKLGGVCGGIAEYFDVDPTLVRIVYAALTLFTAFCGIILYPILYIIMPSKSKVL